MRTAHRTFVATGTVALLAAAGVTAAIAADPAPPPPPKIAFLANGIVPADALAAGPIAGQLGAPIYTTQPDNLSPAAATGLDDYDPELVIVLGGPVAIHDTVIDQVEDATGLTESADATPAGGIVRAAGGDRFDTAAAVADLLAAYNPAFLPVNMQAIDADTVDGKHATDFLAADGKAADAEKLDGKDSTEFQPAGNYLGETETAADSRLLDGMTATEVSFPAVLAPGQSLFGVLMIDAHATASGQYFGDTITFNPRLPARLDGFEYVDSGPTANCPGSVSEPAAEPGYLCLYEQSKDSNSGEPVLLFGVDGPFEELGALIEVLSSSSGDILLEASWAVTPTADAGSSATASSQGTDFSGQNGRR